MIYTDGKPTIANADVDDKGNVTIRAKVDNASEVRVKIPNQDEARRLRRISLARQRDDAMRRAEWDRVYRLLEAGPYGH